MFSPQSRLLAHASPTADTVAHQRTGHIGLVMRAIGLDE